MLQQIIIYLIKVICASGLFFFYYFFALRNKKFHGYNRFYILMSFVLSAVLPLLNLHWFIINNKTPQAVKIYNIINLNSGENFSQFYTKTSSAAGNIFLYTAFVICVAMVILLLLSILKIYLLKRKYTVSKWGNIDFINTDIQQAPFSFLNNIFWRNDILINDKTGRQILQHEITHIKQKHSWDKLFVQLMVCFYWINPFYWLLRKELFLIHEFAADEFALAGNDATAFAKMLLTTNYVRFNFLPAQSIFYSPIKRRLIMLTQSKKTSTTYVRRLMVLPMLATVICLFAFNVKNKKTVIVSQKIKTEKPFVLVVDAGHGGTDYGAVSNDLNEKDVTLKIAEKIKDLSSQYGIDVVLTRDNDSYMSPKEKSDFANKQNANAFISVHVNTNDAAHPNQSGFEVYLAKDNNKTFDNSKVLGSAILQNLSVDFNAEQNLIQREIGIWILNNSNIPAALIECGFITNAKDAANLKDDAKIEMMAKNILQGVAMYANNKVDKSKIYQVTKGN